MRHWTAIAVLGAVCTLAASTPLSAQEDQSESKRKVVTKVSPAYPAIARTMRLKGVVRVEAVVTNNGKVKSVGIRGGHPVLAQAAATAVTKWKWEAASHETTESVEFRFEPEE